MAERSDNHLQARGLLGGRTTTYLGEHGLSRRTHVRNIRHRGHQGMTARAMDARSNSSHESGPPSRMALTWGF